MRCFFCKHWHDPVFNFSFFLLTGCVMLKCFQVSKHPHIPGTIPVGPDAL